MSEFNNLGIFWTLTFCSVFIYVANDLILDFKLSNLNEASTAEYNQSKSMDWDWASLRWSDDGVGHRDTGQLIFTSSNKDYSVVFHDSGDNYVYSIKSQSRVSLCKYAVLKFTKEAILKGQEMKLQKKINLKSYEDQETKKRFMNAK